MSLAFRFPFSPFFLTLFSAFLWLNNDTFFALGLEASLEGFQNSARQLLPVKLNMAVLFFLSVRFLSILTSIQLDTQFNFIIINNCQHNFELKMMVE